MAAAIDAQEIAQLLRISHVYESTFALIGLGVGIVLAAATFYWDIKRHRVGYLDFSLAFFHASIYCSIITGLLIVYFGIPKVLTFGIQFGKILPSSCDASMAFEGYDGLPCALKRFSKWTAGVFCNSNCPPTGKFERIWLEKGVLACLLTVLPLVACFAMRRARLRDEAKESRKTSES